MEASIEFFEDYITYDIKFDMQDLFELRCNCSGLKEEDEKKLLNAINDILAINQHKDLTNIINNTNLMLSRSLYYDGRNKYERVLFSIDDYKTPASKRDIVFIPV